MRKIILGLVVTSLPLFLETFPSTVFKVQSHNYLIQVNELLKVFSVVGSGDYLEVAFLVHLGPTVQSGWLPTEQK